jgi:hypothetical protein
MPRKIRPQFTYANVISTLCLFLLLAGGSALAATQLGKNSVGSRQLKSKAVTTGKVAPNAINGSKVANGSLTGEDINLKALGTVPSSSVATKANDATTVAGHSVSCPAESTLIRGVCYDSSLNPEAESYKAAAEACAVKGGTLPSVAELYEIRNLINLGNGTGNEHAVSSEVYANTAQANYSTIVVDGTGAITEQPIVAPSRYVCAYPLVR